VQRIQSTGDGIRIEQPLASLDHNRSCKC
jgi:hypothetical protein